MAPKPKPGHARFKFVGTDGGGRFLVWESVAPLPGDSRHQQIRCPRAWFWKGLAVTNS